MSLSGLRGRVKTGALHEINFRRYYIGQSLSGFGDSLVTLALAFAVLNLTGSAAALGIVLLSSRVPLTAFVLLGGVLGDRLPRRNIMLVADVVRMLAHGATAALLLTGEVRLWHLIVLQAIAGAGTAFFNPAASGLVRSVVSKERLQEANSLLGLSRNVFSVFSLAVSGVLVATVGTGWAFAINAATFGASVVFLARMQLADDRVPIPGRFFEQLLAGFGYVRAHTWLLVTVVYTALLNASVIAPLMVLGPAVAKARLGGAASWAAILIATACGAIAGSAAALKLRPRRLLATSLVAVLGTIPMTILLAVAAPTWAIVPAAVLFGAQSSFYVAVSATLIQTHVSPSAISRVSACNSLGSLVLVPVGFALAGSAADRFGTAPVLWFSAGWVLLSTLVALSFRDVRVTGVDAPSEPEPTSTSYPPPAFTKA